MGRPRLGKIVQRVGEDRLQEGGHDVPSLKLVVMPGTHTPLNSNLWPTTALACLASVARSRGFPVAVLDGHLDRATTCEAEAWIACDPPSVLGFSVPSEIVWERTRELIARLVRHPSLRETWFVAGGVDGSLRWRTLLDESPRLDAVVRGEGEAALVEILEARRGGLAHVPPLPGVVCRRDGGQDLVDGGRRPSLECLDDLPFPDYGFARTAWREGRVEALGIASSRGCPGRCRFCCIHPHWECSPGRRWRAHGAPYVVSLVARLQEEFGFSSLAFTDDCFLGAPHGLARAEAIGQGLQHLPRPLAFSIMLRVADVVHPGAHATLAVLKQAGLASAFLGLDGCTAEDLQWFRKGATLEDGRQAVRILADLGIGTVIGALPLHPRSTRESVLAALDFVEEMLALHPGLHFTFLSRLVLFQGTPIHEEWSDNPNGAQVLPPSLEGIMRPWITKYRLLVGHVREHILGHAPPESLPARRRALCRWQIDTLRAILQRPAPPKSEDLKADYLALMAALARESSLSDVVRTRADGPPVPPEPAVIVCESG